MESQSQKKRLRIIWGLLLSTIEKAATKKDVYTFRISKAASYPQKRSPISLNIESFIVSRMLHKIKIACSDKLIDKFIFNFLHIKTCVNRRRLYMS